MMWLYVLLVAVVAAAVPVTWWLKREGDHRWRQRRLLAPMAKRFDDWMIEVTLTADVENFVREMKRAGRAVEELGRAMRRRRRRMWMRAFVNRVTGGIL